MRVERWVTNRQIICAMQVYGHRSRLGGDVFFRIPLPELTAEDKEKLGERGASYEGRLRYHYMPASESRASGGAGTGSARTGGEGPVKPPPLNPLLPQNDPRPA